MPNRLVARFRGSRLAAILPVTVVAVAAALTIPSAAGAQSDPACYGAAARDGERPCRNPALRLAVRPTPEAALLQSFSPCRTVEHKNLLLVCNFRTSNPDSQETVALVGDSHASHWRPALEGVVEGLGVRGISIARTGCPFTRARSNLAEPYRSQCSRWNAQVLRWFEAHPEVQTVFISQHAGARVIPPQGQDGVTAQMDGYIDAWNALPPSVKRIVVIRDVPKNTSFTTDCIERAIRARRPAGSTCAVPRKFALGDDRARLAALRRRSKRVRVLNMTPYFCSKRLCPPVIGGVLVHKDVGHITLEYSRTLGPYVLRGFKRLLKTWDA